MEAQRATRLSCRRSPVLHLVSVSMSLSSSSSCVSRQSSLGLNLVYLYGEHLSSLGATVYQRRVGVLHKAHYEVRVRVRVRARVRNRVRVRVGLGLECTAHGTL